MQKNNYKCRNTGNKHGLQLWEVCPDCGDRDCLDVDSKGPEIPWKKILIFIIPIIVVFVIFKNCGKTGTEIKKANFGLNILPTDSNTGVLFSISEGGNKSTQKITSIAEVFLKDKSINSRIEDNVFYPCADELGVLNFKIKPKNQNVINNDGKEFSIIVEIKGNNGAASLKAKCPLKINFISVSEILPSGNIVIGFDSSISSQIKSKNIKVFVSISGQKGPYEEKLIWPVCDGSKNPFVLNVYCFIENQADTVPCNSNGDIRNRSIVCFPPDPEKANVAAKNFLKQLNTSFESGDISNIFDPLYPYISKGLTRVRLRGKLLSGGIKELEMTLLNEHGDFINDGRNRVFLMSWKVNPNTGYIDVLQIDINIR